MKDLSNTIKHFKALLTCEQFIVTGSYALNIYGLIDSEPKDLDIILVNPSLESMETINRLQNEAPAKRLDTAIQDFLKDRRIDGAKQFYTEQ